MKEAGCFSKPVCRQTVQFEFKRIFNLRHLTLLNRYGGIPQGCALGNSFVFGYYAFT